MSNDICNYRGICNIHSIFSVQMKYRKHFQLPKLMRLTLATKERKISSPHGEMKQVDPLPFLN